MALPRLTGALRAFSGLSGDAGGQDISPDDLQRELSVKRHARSQQQTDGGLSWKTLVSALRKRSIGVSEDIITHGLRDLTHIARDIGK